MIRRLYVNNYRCLENFELLMKDQHSVLLIGKNGAGKTTVGRALAILQKIARGTNRVDSLVKPRDLTRGQTGVPLRFEIEVDLGSRSFAYTIALDYPEGFKELRVLEEKLSVDGRPIYTRAEAQVNLARTGQDQEARFRIDWHLVALPIVQEKSPSDPLFIFKQWLSRLIILRPMPSLITGDSQEETLQPEPDVTNFGAWFSGLLADAPAAYGVIDNYLKQVMPDLKDIKNRLVAKDARSLSVQFSNDQGALSIPFEDLSDGEKCFMISALVLAAADAYGPLLCFWDEPDNYLALDEVQQFVMDLRRAFQSSGQFIATSHNQEAIRSFSNENTLLLHRRNHLEPTTVRRISELNVIGDLASALARGDVP